MRFWVACVNLGMTEVLMASWTDLSMMGAAEEALRRESAFVTRQRANLQTANQVAGDISSIEETIHSVRNGLLQRSLEGMSNLFVDGFFDKLANSRQQAPSNCARTLVPL
jgi:hypothetical protein